MKPILLISLTLLVSGSSASWFSSREKIEECKASGLFCSDDCKTVEYCPGAKVPSNTIRECDSGTFCSAKSGIPECDAKSCPSAKPSCPAPGPIPSPTDCHIFFICSAAEDHNPFEQKCGDAVFNPVTSACDPSLKCRTPVVCPKAGDNGFVDPDTKIFCYYCTDVNTPYIYPCPKTY